ncbi:MAG: ATPase, partial [Clostridia bacterium]|nr:ATPase [Clostridia bacterium]
MPEKEYAREQEDLLRELGTSPEGLSSAESEARRQTFGENKLREAKKPGVIRRFFEELKDPMLLILLAAAAVSAVTNILAHESLTEVFIILVVVILNAVLGVFQE